MLNILIQRYKDKIVNKVGAIPDETEEAEIQKKIKKRQCRKDSSAQKSAIIWQKLKIQDVIRQSSLEDIPGNLGYIISNGRLKSGECVHPYVLSQLEKIMIEEGY